MTSTTKIDRTMGLGSDGVFRIEWGSLTDLFAEAFDARDGQTAAIDWYLANQANGRWVDHYTVAQLRAALATLPPGVADAIETARREIETDLPLPTHSRRHNRRRRECGDDLNADAFLECNPDCWDRMERQAVARPFVRLGVNLAANCNRTFADNVYRGAAVVALADHLIARGMNVEIIAFSACTEASTGHRGTLVASVVLKPAEAPLDLATVAFCLCEIAVFRLAVLPAEVRHLPGRLNGGWGHAARLPAIDRRLCDYIADADLIGRELALAWLRSCLDRVATAEAVR